MGSKSFWGYHLYRRDIFPIKVRIFWQGYKIWKKSSSLHIFDVAKYCFVAFSENLTLSTSVKLHFERHQFTKNLLQLPNVFNPVCFAECCTQIHLLITIVAAGLRVGRTITTTLGKISWCSLVNGPFLTYVIANIYLFFDKLCGS